MFLWPVLLYRFACGDNMCHHRTRLSSDFPCRVLNSYVHTPPVQTELFVLKRNAPNGTFTDGAYRAYESTLMTTS